MPGQQMRCDNYITEAIRGTNLAGVNPRKKNVRRKLNAMALEFSGKNVLIVDGEFL